MLRRFIPALLVGLVGAGFFATTPARAQAPAPVAYQPLNRFFYYPYYYFPHNYWPTNQPVWPERPGEMYRKPPSYMAYPAFHEPHWRYDLHERMSYYRGFHFWLDAF